MRSVIFFLTKFSLQPSSPDPISMKSSLSLIATLSSKNYHLFLPFCPWSKTPSPKFIHTSVAPLEWPWPSCQYFQLFLFCCKSFDVPYRERKSPLFFGLLDRVKWYIPVFVAFRRNWLGSGWPLCLLVVDIPLPWLFFPTSQTICDAQPNKQCRCSRFLHRTIRRSVLLAKDAIAAWTTPQIRWIKSTRRMKKYSEKKDWKFFHFIADCRFCWLMDWNDGRHYCLSELGRLMNEFIEWIGRSIDWLTDWVTDWLISNMLYGWFDWLIDLIVE